MSESSPCTERVGCGCSRCTSPAVTTALISGDPWPALFTWISGVDDGFGGSGHTNSDPWVYVFHVEPGDTLPYYRVEWDNGEFDWDPSAAIITDEDGNVVSPDDIWDEAQDFTLTIDPTNMDIPGQYDGGIVVSRSPTPGRLEDDEDATTEDGSWEVEEVCTDTAQVKHARTDTLFMEITVYSGNPVYAMFPITRVGPLLDCNDAAIPAGWSISADLDIPGTSSYTLRNGDDVLTEGAAQDPLFTNAYVFLMLTLTTTGMVEGTEYTGTITITSDDGTTTVRAVTIRYKTYAEKTHEFILSIENPVVRGTAQDLLVTAIKLDTGEADPDYAGGRLRLNLTQESATADTITPATYDSTGLWASGNLIIPNIVVDDGAGDLPVLQVADFDRAVRGILVLNSGSFILTIPDSAALQREEAFDVEIQAVINNAEIWRDYIPETTVSMVLTSPDGGDSMLPATTDNTGWVEGKKTVSCTISGGTGLDAVTIRATDTLNTWTGFKAATVVAPNFSVTVNAGSDIIRAVAFDIIIQKLQTDGTPDVGFTPVANVNINFTGDVADVIAPLFTSNAGWVAGAKTVSCTVTGGTGTDAFTLEVEDATTSLTGDATGNVGDAAPAACPGIPPLPASYTLAWTGQVYVYLGPYYLWTTPPYTPNNVPSFCNWYRLSFSEKSYLKLDLTGVPVWELELSKNFGSGYRTYIIAIKYGDTPVGDYVITYRNTHSCTNTIADISVY